MNDVSAARNFYGEVLGLTVSEEHGMLRLHIEVAETIKRTTQPYFVLSGNICALLATSDHVNVFLYDGGMVPDLDGVITAGHGNKTARTVAINEGNVINAPALREIFKQIISNNRAGGWMALKRQGQG